MKLLSNLFTKNKSKDAPKADNGKTDKPRDEQQTNLVALRYILNQLFSLDQIRMLCFDLEVNFDDLPGDNKSMKIKALIDVYTRPPHDMTEFLSHMSEVRPDIPWNDPQTFQKKFLSLSETTRLAQVISYCFSENELRNLCFDLGVNYEDFPGRSKKNHARELILQFDRSPEGLNNLIQQCIKLRPKAPWQNPDITNYQPYPPEQLAALVAHLAVYFDDDEIKELCKVFNVNYRYLPGAYEGGISRELVLYLSRREQIPDLLELCQEKRPEIDWFNIQIPPEEDFSTEDLSAGDIQQIREELASTFSDNQIRNLCFVLGVDVENLVGTPKAYELVNYMQRHSRTPELMKAMNQLSQ